MEPIVNIMFKIMRKRRTSGDCNVASESRSRYEYHIPNWHAQNALARNIGVSGGLRLFSNVSAASSTEGG